MARPREFDVDDAVRDAMAVFWREGHAGASLNALIAGTGISRGSLYKAFGTKQALFLAALARYERDVCGPLLARLRDGPGDGPARVGRVFDAAVTAARAGDRRGCLMANTALEGSDAPEVRRALAVMIARLKDAFGAALAGSVPDPRRRRDRARMLGAAYLGLQAMARAGEPDTVLASVAAEARRLAAASAR